MLGELKDSQIENLLYSQVIGRIGCFANNKVYIVPVTYAYDGYYIFGHTKEGMKINMMRENPKICFEVDVIDNMSNWRSVIAWGTYKELQMPKDRENVMRKLLDRISPIMTGESTVQNTMKDGHSKFTDAMSGVVYKIKLTTKTGRYEKK